MMQIENSTVNRSVRPWEWDRYDNEFEDDDEEVFEDDDIDEY